MAFMHVETQTKKLDNKAWEGRLVGCIGNSKSFRIYNPATRKVLESRNVIFIQTPSISPNLGLRLTSATTSAATSPMRSPKTFYAIFWTTNRVSTPTRHSISTGNSARQLIIDA